MYRTIPKTFEYKGYIFPKGFDIACSPLTIHRNPDVWSEPDKFNPEREIPSESVGSFLAFGAGPRICIGKNFFYHEAWILLATMLRVARFELDPTKESGVMTSVTGLLRPTHVWTQIHPRSN